MPAPPPEGGTTIHAGLLYHHFLKLYARHVAPVADTYAYCLLRNHFKAYGRTGSLFEHPFERIEVTSERYLMRLVIYIHHNPQKHGLIADFRAWPYSSYHSLRSNRPTPLRRDEVIGWFGGPAQVEEAHRLSSVDRRLAPFFLEDFDP